MSTHYCPYMRLKSPNKKTNSASIAQINVARSPIILIGAKELPIKEWLVILGCPGKSPYNPTKLIITMGFQNHGEFDSTWEKGFYPSSGTLLLTWSYTATFCAQYGPIFLESIPHSSSKRNWNPGQRSALQVDTTPASSTSFLANMPKANFSIELQFQTGSPQTPGEGRQRSDFCTNQFWAPAQPGMDDLLTPQ